MKKRYDLNEPPFRAQSIDIQHVSRQKGYSHSFPSGREKHGFIYVENGAMLDSFRGCGVEKLQIEAGELIFVPKGCVYTGTYLENGTQITLLQFELLTGELPEYLSRPTKIALPHLRELMEAFSQTVENRISFHPFYSLSCLYTLLWRINEHFEKIPQKYKKLLPALTEIEAHPEQNDKISRYTALCDMSEANFRRLFREYTGMSPVDYRNDIRLFHAKSKLQSGEYNVSEAAYSSGFSNLSFFTRLYKKKYGYTPKKENF